MMLNTINEMGNRKLDTKSTIWASSLGISLITGGAGVLGGAGGGALTTAGACGIELLPIVCVIIGGEGAVGGVDCCEMPDMDTAESTCNELLLCGVLRIEFE